eukprot:g3836.t1
MLHRGIVLDPGSDMMRRWDATIVLALLFTAIVTPYEVSVMKAISYPQVDALFVVNRFVDIIFVVDIVLKFFTMYRQPNSKGGGWVRNQRLIARHYARRWFAVDLVSVLPFDIVAYSLGSASKLSKYKLLRVVRLLRLLKLMRILRANRIFKRWETSISIPFAWLSLCKFGVMLVSIDHWIACAWALVALGECDHQCTEEVALCRHNGASLDVTACVPVGRSTWLTQWVLEKAPPGFTPGPHDIYLDFRHTMDELNSFMKTKGIPSVLRRDLRSYFHQARTLQESQSSKQLLDQMSPNLKGLVAMHTVGTVMNRVQFLKDSDPDFLVELAQRFENAVFAPNELMDEHDVMYQIVRGLAVLEGRIIGQNF